MKKLYGTAYLAATLGLCLLPFAGMVWEHGGASSENRKLSALPAVRTEQGWNLELLPQLGEYFEEHFAYRQSFVTADALLRSSLLGVSAESGVIDGTDGWLYYSDSLDDYLGQNLLSDRAVYNIAHTLRMIQDYVEDSGRGFLFTVAPNKNSLYGEHMPYYDSVKVSDDRNIDRLRAELEAQGVHYKDLYSVLEDSDETLYHKTDSHWNNKGAALAASALLDALGQAHRPYEAEDFETRTDFEGDLAKMLTPERIVLEEEYYLTDGFAYEYTEAVESNFEPDIRTVCAEGEGGLLMYRDSFGNALLPFLAEEYENARFTRGIPYYIDDMVFCEADDVVIERAERFLPDMAQNPPVFRSPEAPELLGKLAKAQVLDAAWGDEADSPAGEAVPGNGAAGNVSGGADSDASSAYATCDVSEDGLFVKLSGIVDEALVGTDSRIYLCVDGETVYEAFPMSVSADDAVCDSGYVAYIEKERLLEEDEIGIRLYAEQGDTLTQVYASTAELDFEL